MTRRTERERAEACFAVARSTSHAGERAAAIGRGLAICTRARLDPATFAVPGQRRAPPHRPVLDDAPAREANDYLRAAMEQLARSLEAAQAATGATADETAWEARRRNFDEACAAAKARDARRAMAAEAAATADRLSAAGVLVYRDGDGWILLDQRGAHVCDHAGLIAIAAERTVPQGAG